MKISFKNPGEAFVALTTLIMYADGRASIKELNFVLNNFISQPLGGITIIGSDDLFRLFLKTKNKILKALNKSGKKEDFTVFNKKDGEQIIKAAGRKLNSKQSETIFLLLTELAYADGLTEEEQYFIDLLRKRLSVNKKIADLILEIIPVKFREPAPQVSGNDLNQQEIYNAISDVFLSLELAIIFADQNIHMKQTSHIFWNLTLLNVFKNISSEEFQQMKEKILTKYGKNVNQPAAFSDEELAVVFGQAKAVLSPELLETALCVATELAYSTGINEPEKKLIDRFITEMKIDKKFARNVFKTMKIKFRTTI